jgi:LemA protein
MKKWTLLIIIGVLVFLGVWFSGMYNSMVDKQEEATKMWADVETQYQRRADLIPNLVETVKGYASHEKEALTAVMEARAKASSVKIDPSNMTAEDMQNFNAAQGGLNSALSRLMVVVERYPDLKANQNFLQLQSQLEGTENRIAVARSNFNEVTTEYNKYIKKFPRVLFAGMMGFDARPLFESKEGTDVAPEVKF